MNYYFYYFRIIIKNLTKCNILNTLTLKKIWEISQTLFRKIVSLVLGLGLDDSCSWPRKRLSFERSVLNLGLERCVFDSTSAIYDVYLSAWKNGSCQVYLPSRFQTAVLVLGLTLLVVIRIWCFHEWFISSYIKGKVMTNSVYTT